MRHNRLLDSFNQINYQTTTSQIDEISEAYIAYLSTFPHLFKGTIPLLNKLKSKYKLHIITNGFEQVQHFKIKNSGLDSYFDFVFKANSFHAGHDSYVTEMKWVFDADDPDVLVNTGKVLIEGELVENYSKLTRVN